MLTFRPMLNECVVVMRGSKVAGTIRRYRAHKGCIVSVPGVLTSGTNPGQCFYRTVAQAKSAILAADKGV